MKAYLATEQRIPGLGNGVLQDILLNAKIHPKKKMNTLSDGQRRELFDSVNIGCTVENQALADYRLSRFLSYPIKRRFVACSPLLEAIDLSRYLYGIDHVTVNGETGREARICDYDWVLDIREQCVKAGKTFWFKGTGSFFKLGGEVQKVNPFKQGRIAKELGISISDGKRLF